MAERSARRLGTRLRRLRVENRLSQKELAAPLFTHAYVSTIEAGKRVPSERALTHFASKLGVEVDELATGRPPRLEENLELELAQARRETSAGHIAQARTRYEEVRSTAERYSLGRLGAKAVYGLGLCEERSMDNEAAIELYTHGLEALGERHPDVRADLVAGKARCVQHQGDTTYAVYLLDSLLGEFRRRSIEDPAASLKLHAPLAFAALEAGMVTKARESAATALRLAAEVDDPLTLAIGHINAARVLLADGEAPAAMRSLQRAEELFDSLHLELELGRAHLTQGYVLAREGDRSAGDQLARALEIFRKIGSRIDAARALDELGNLALAEERHQDAIGFFEAALELMEADEHVAEVALANRSLGRAAMSLDPERAEKHLREAVGLYERAEMPLQVAYTYRLLGELMEEQGRDAGAEFRATAMALPEV